MTESEESPQPQGGGAVTRRTALVGATLAAAGLATMGSAVRAASPGRAARRAAAGATTRQASPGANPTVSPTFATTLTLTAAFGLLTPPLTVPAGVTGGSSDVAPLFNGANAGTWVGAAAFSEWFSQYPNVKVKVVPALWGGAEGGKAPLLTQLAGGTAPDIFPDYGDNPAPYVAENALADLTPFAKDWSGFQGLPSALQATATVNGKIYALPGGAFGGYCVAYRKDLFDAAHVPYPSPDWTLTDYMQLAVKLTDPKKKVWGTNILWQYTNWFFSLFAEAMGVPTPGYFFAVPNEEGTNYAYAPPEELARPLAFYQQLVKSGGALWGSSETFGQITNDLIGGRVAMAVKMTKQLNGLLANIGKPGFVQPDQIGVVPFPMGPEGLRVWELGSNFYSINAQVTGEKLALAWQLLRDMLGAPGTSFAYAAGALANQIPALPSPYPGVLVPEHVLRAYPAEWLDTLNSTDILRIPALPQAASYGIPPYPPGAQSGLDPYVQKALVNPNMSALSIAQEAVATLTATKLQGALPGLTKDKWHAYYRALGAFFQKYYPKYYAGTYTKYYKRYETW
jgi:maltose-binding protein MalE